MKCQTCAFVSLASLAPIATANWDFGPWSNICTDSCAKEWADSPWPEDAQGFCSNDEILSSATECIATASCRDEEKAEAKASISSLCSGATADTTPTDAAHWSGWGGDHDAPWTRGGPFGGGWGPWGGDGPWTSFGPWTSWWDGEDCPGSTWSGWTDGPWRSNADWTTWNGCTATTTPIAMTTTVDGVERVTTTYDTQVAQVTGVSDASVPSAGIDSSESGSATSKNLDSVVVAVGAVVAGVVGLMVFS